MVILINGSLCIGKYRVYIIIYRPSLLQQLKLYAMTGINIYILLAFCRSESPSQVFVIVISWLLEVLKGRHESEWKEVILCYDNMCHLDGLKVAKQDLPLDTPYNKM